MEILGVGAVDYPDPITGQLTSRELGIYVVEIENGQRTPAYIYPDHVYDLKKGNVEGLETIATILHSAMHQLKVPFGLKDTYRALAEKTLAYVKSLPSRIREPFLVYRESWEKANNTVSVDKDNVSYNISEGQRSELVRILKDLGILSAEAVRPELSLGKKFVYTTNCEYRSCLPGLQHLWTGNTN